MNSDDRLLTSHDAAMTDNDVAVPSFHSIRERGNRVRRRRRALTTGTVAAAAIASVALLPWSTVPPGTTPPGTVSPVVVPPSPTGPRTTGPSVKPPTPLAELPKPQDPSDPVLLSVVSAIDDAELHATTWVQYGEHIIMVTRADETPIELPSRTGDSAPLVSSLGEGLFHVLYDDGSHVVVDREGTETPVVVTERIGPLAAGELTVRGSTPGVFLGLDPNTSTAHWLTVPAGTRTLLTHPDGSLVGTALAESRQSVVWSHDGGTSWQERFVTDDPEILVDVIPSAAADTFAVVEHLDGATVMQAHAVHRSTNAGADWETFPVGQQTPSGTYGVRADGRLVVDVSRLGTLVTPGIGFYVSAEGDWSSFDSVFKTTPSPLPQGGLQDHDVVDMSTIDDQLVLTAWSGWPGSAQRSVDGGSNWVTLEVG